MLRRHFLYSEVHVEPVGHEQVQGTIIALYFLDSVQPNLLCVRDILAQLFKQRSQRFLDDGPHLFFIFLPVLSFRDLPVHFPVLIPQLPLVIIAEPQLFAIEVEGLL